VPCGVGRTSHPILRIVGCGRVGKERAILPAAISGDDKAQARLVQFMDRRARMMGLDKPERFEHTVITMDAVEAEIARLEREMTERERTDA